MMVERVGQSRGQARSGLTLTELLVVLVILAVVTAIAVQSTEVVIDQGRYNATRQTLQNIQNAVIGQANQRAPDGSQLITGFVADMGRLPLPVYQNTVLVGDPLRELWDVTAVAANSGTTYGLQSTTIPIIGASNPVLMNPASSLYNNTTSPAPLTVTIPCGWRGPYLQLPVGSAGRLLDGWGNPFQSLYQAPGSSVFPTTPGAGLPVNVVCSPGADNAFDQVLPGSAYNLDQYVPVQSTAPPTAPLTSFSDLSGGSIPAVVKAYNTTVSPPTPIDPLAVGRKDFVVIVFFTPGNGLLTPVSSTSVSLVPSFTGTLTSGSPNITGVSSTTGLVVGQVLVSPQLSFPTTATIAAISGSTVTMSQAYNGTTSGTVTITPATPVSYTFSSLTMTTPPTIGPRALQAFQYDGTSGTVARRSPLTYVMVPSGGVPTQTLILQ